MQFLSQSWTAQVALSGLAAFGVCYATGLMVGEEEPTKKKQERGPNRAVHQPRQIQNEIRLDTLLKSAETCELQGRFAEAEVNYAEALEMLETVDDPSAWMLETVFSSRLAMCCEKQQKYEEAERYYLRCVSNFEGRNLGPQELVEFSEVLERTVEICMSRLKNAEKAIRPLTLWIKVAEDLGSESVHAICCNLLTKIHASMGKYEEASRYGLKAVAALRKRGVIDEVTLSTVFFVIEAYHAQGKHEDTRKLVEELAAYASALTPPPNAVAMTASLAGWSFDHDYFLESQNLMMRAIELANRYGCADRDDIAQYENTIAQALAERGKLDEARAYTNKIAATLGTASPPLTISKYLKTIDTIILDKNRKAYCVVKLETRESRKPPSTAIIVCKVDNPAGGAPIEHQQMIEADRAQINFDVELPFAVVGCLIAQLDIYTDATKTHRLSSHFVLCQSESPIARLIDAPPPSIARTEAAPLNFVEHHVGNQTVVEATVGDTTIVGTTDGSTTVIAGTDGDTTIIETISGDAVIKETITGDVRTIEGTDGVETIKAVSDGTTTVLERTNVVDGTTEVEVIREDSQ